MTNHLLKRGSRYYIRRKIPIDLRAHYQGRKEIVKALGTSDPADARRLVREESVWLDREFDRLRADPSQNASATDDKPAVYDALSGKSYRPRVTTLTRAQADEMVQDMHESAELFEEPLDAQYANHDRQVARETERQAKHERQVSAYEEALCRIVARHGSLPTTPSSAIRADLRAAEQNRREGGPSVGHLAALAEQWAKERKPTVRTVRKAELIVERFYTLVGRVPVASITRTHVLTFKNKLLESGQTAVNTNKQLT
ncbi:MAG TPA: DUF6538 domain-containing protein, partial [Trinickia sp.]|uniref:DUF6538 domain-containing protein n=1 Tax=Trinickia sp. TaxID=2571163 RepID=UPI002B86BF73